MFRSEYQKTNKSILRLLSEYRKKVYQKKIEGESMKQKRNVERESALIEDRPPAGT